MSSLSLSIRFVLPVKARIVYNYGWNYVQSSVCEHLFTCQAHLFYTHCCVQQSRAMTSTVVFNCSSHTPPNYVVECGIAHRKPPDVRIWRLSNQSRVGTLPPSTSTPHCPACWARRW